MAQIESAIDEPLSRAIVVWSGFGVSLRPQRSAAQLDEEFGCKTAVDLVSRVVAMEDSFYTSDARLTAPDLESMGRQAAAEFRTIHPEISEEAVEALAWCYIYDYK